MPKFSIVTPVYNPPAEALQACIASMKSQTFTDWEWCIVDDKSSAPHVSKILDKAQRGDARIRVAYREQNGGIVAASQDALDLATGEFIGLLDHDDALHATALQKVAARLDTDSTIDYLYTDEDKLDENGLHYDVFRKPGWDKERLRGQNYCCHFSVFRATLLDKVGGFRQGFEGSQDYDIILRATEQARTIAHIPEVLYHWRCVPGSAAADTDAKPYAYESGRKALEEHFARCDIDATVEMSLPGHYQHRLNKLKQSPLVSIIIPTRGDRKKVWGITTCLIVNAIESIIKTSTYSNFEVVVVNDVNLDGTSIHAFDAPSDARVRIISYDKQFNFSDKCNVGFFASKGEVVIMLNDDTQVITPDWIEQLIGHLEDPEVAMVGPMLLLEDGRIQSAGHTNKPTPSHIGSGESGSAYGMWGMYTIARSISGLTAACVAIRRSVFEEVGGFSLEYPINFNDVDFCFKVLDAGYRIVWTPMARLYHFESMTRVLSVDQIEINALEKRWKRYFGVDVYTP